MLTKTCSEVSLYFVEITFLTGSIWDRSNGHRPLRRWTLHMQTSFQDRNVLRSLLWKLTTITDNNDLQVSHHTVKSLSYKYISCLNMCMDGEGNLFWMLHTEMKAHFQHITSGFYSNLKGISTSCNCVQTSWWSEDGVINLFHAGFDFKTPYYYIFKDI
jgi:hypothetical protein